MRINSRKKESPLQQRRAQWLRERAAAQTLRRVFPDVEQIRVELMFAEISPRTPAAQAHAVHPPARAFFEYPCPFADCDGTFDLTPFAARAVSSATLNAAGELECSGVRSRDGLQRQACGLHVHYTIAAQPVTSNGSSS